MTVGNSTFGSTVAVGTNFGLSYIRNGVGRKTWSGADNPKQPKQSDYYEIPKDYVKWVRVPGQKKKVRIVVKRMKLKKFRVYPRRLKSQTMHNYTVHYEKQDDQLMKFKLNGVGTEYSATATAAGFGDLGFSFPVISNNDELEYLSMLRKKVNGSKFNLGSFLGEGHQSLSMIRGAATKLAWGLKAWHFAVNATTKNERQFHARNAARYLTEGTDRQKISRKTPASNWLELQYGWFPLLQDAQDGAKMLAHFLEVPFHQTVKFGSMKSGSISGAASSQPGWGGACHTRVSYTALIKERNIAQLSGLTDIASVAWELMPYSFVVDWFIPIGDYLQARGTLSGVDCTLARWKTNVGEITSSSSRTATGYVKTVDARFSKVWVDGGRTIIAFPEPPLPELKGFGEVLNWKRTANAVALLSQSLVLKK